MTVSLQKIGEALGMSREGARKAALRGMPKDSVEAAIEWYARNRNRAYGNNRQPEQVAKVAPRLRVADDENFDQARTRKERALADQAEMDAAERAGSLIDRAKYTADMGRQFAAIRQGLLNIAARMAPTLAAMKSPAEVETALDTEIRAVLSQFVGEAV